MANPESEDQGDAVTGAYIVALYGTWTTYGFGWYINQPPCDVEYILKKEALYWDLAVYNSSAISPCHITKIRISKV